MINFDFYTPTRVLFGADRENEAWQTGCRILVGIKL